ncbi:MAG TPA: helix-turn-helix domain-containing protein [Ktedonobacterales bacterium]|jgi:AcrR family transcriptional regulator
MTENRTKRRYDASRRQSQARETRRLILEAAYQLFTTRGYEGATMEALAQVAGVAVETVYAAFGSKRAVFAQLVDTAVGGDDEQISLLDRPEQRQVREETNQQQQIRLFAHGMRKIMGRVGPLFGVMRGASLAEPEIAALLQRLLHTRHETLAVFVEWVRRNGPLRAGLSTEQAADTVWTLSSAEVHHLLTVDRGWAPERYEQWLSDALIALLLPTDASPA